MDDAPADSAETQRLLERVESGDAAAFDAVFDRHRAGLREFLDHRIDDRLRARFDPSDVVQEAQLVAFRRLDDYLARRPMPFGVWLRKTAYERLLMLRRKHRRTHRRGVGREEPLPERSSLGLARRLSRSSTPGDRMIRAERAERVRQLLAKLSAEDREMLLMRNYEDLPYGEIAALLEITPATARQRHGRALLRLSRLLGDQSGSADV
jgi:RNA polymerase sigma-70 factor (ECF subfamily)